jgi:hypothetical protein
MFLGYYNKLFVYEILNTIRQGHKNVLFVSTEVSLQDKQMQAVSIPNVTCTVQQNKHQFVKWLCLLACQLLIHCHKKKFNSFVVVII